MKFFLVMCILGALAGCGASKTSNPTNDGVQESDLDSNLSRGALKICSPLNVPNTNLSSILTPFRRSVLLLGLSVSGSFEGNDGWANLSDDFDGQGLSLGLLNQNLGTGSLQPLLIKMRDNYPAAFQKAFNSEQFFGVEEMLAQWQVNTSVIKRKVIYSSLDQPPVNQGDEPNWDVFEKANMQSAEWARTTLYKNNSFVPDWRNALQKLAKNKSYVLLQVQAAVVIHRETEALMKSFGLNSVRAYLFFFDITTQNGGLYPQDQSEMSSYLSKRPVMSEEDKLKAILSIRLNHVRKQYRSDVLARKMAIINGQGAVHGAYRNLEQTYCYKGSRAYFKNQ